MAQITPAALLAHLAHNPKEPKSVTPILRSPSGQSKPLHARLCSARENGGGTPAGGCRRADYERADGGGGRGVGDLRPVHLRPAIRAGRQAHGASAPCPPGRAAAPPPRPAAAVHGGGGVPARPRAAERVGIRPTPLLALPRCRPDPRSAGPIYGGGAQAQSGVPARPCAVLATRAARQPAWPRAAERTGVRTGALEFAQVDSPSDNFDSNFIYLVMNLNS